METDIKVFEPPYDKKEFYGYMGDIFSMKTVRREMPYLSNDQTRVWFLALHKNEIVGFCSLEEHGDHISLLCDYVFPPYRGNGIYSKLVDTRLKYAEKFNKTMKIACFGDNFTNMFFRRGFLEYKRTKFYRFLFRDRVT